MKWHFMILVTLVDQMIHQGLVFIQDSFLPFLNSVGPGQWKVRLEVGEEFSHYGKKPLG